MVNIREYKEPDEHAVANLLASLQELVANLDPLEQFIRGDEFDKVAYLRQVREMATKNNGAILVAENDSGIVGVALGWIKEPKSDVTLHPKKIAYISDLVVATSAQRKGVGHALLETIEAHFTARHCDYIALSYMVQNAQAHDFYLKNGYDDYSARMVKRLNA